MNACDDQALVKNCIVELFLLIGGRPDLLQEGESIDTNLFKMFRRLLIQTYRLRRKSQLPTFMRIFFRPKPK